MDGVPRVVTDAGVRNGVVIADADVVFYNCYLHGSQPSAGFYFAIAIVGSRSGCGYCCCGVLVALGGTDIIVTKMMIEDVSTLLLMLLNDC